MMRDSLQPETDRTPGQAAPFARVPTTGPRLALFGQPGSGKSTTSALLAAELARVGMVAHILKLAQPLYDLQEALYNAAGRPLQDTSVQDAQVLSFLGSKIRQINADALTDDFARRVAALEARDPSAAVVCDDMRKVDAPALRRLGFRFVKVATGTDMARARLSARGDLTYATDEAFEATAGIPQDVRIVNDGTVAALRRAVAELVRGELRQ